MRKPIVQALLIMVAAVSLISCATPDSVITAKVKAQMMADETIRSSQFDVSTQNGVVTLTGTVATQETKDRAIHLARDTSGVVDVVDMISVRVSEDRAEAPEPDRTVGQRIDDAAITVRVKTQLLDDPVIKGTRIDVDTREGVVYLTGSVRSEAERDKAIELTRKTRGVRNVQVDLRVTSS